VLAAIKTIVAHFQGSDDDSIDGWIQNDLPVLADWLKGPMTTINKADIAQQLRTMVEERLFGAKGWPIDDNAAVHQQLIDWGLIEMQEDNIHTTALGAELSVDYWSMFMGHHELSEIPDLLVEYGLLAKEDANHIIFDVWERDT